MQTQIVNAAEYRSASQSLPNESAIDLRRTCEETALKEPAEPIRVQCVHSPLHKHLRTKHGFQMMAGARRSRAARMCVVMMLLMAGFCLTMRAQDAVQMLLVRPSQADPAITRYDEPNVVLVPPGSSAATPLALFLPGTGGKPQNADLLLHVIAGQGYRVIGLSYNDEPSLSKVCPQRPNPECSARFREMRVFGHGPAPVDNPPDATIEARLAALLRFLNRRHPGDGWGAYLTPDGLPQWNRILVSGLSQGAGMAAFIAKQYPVYRVVLFSSPWDTTGRDHHPAPWLAAPSATPMDRWWAERHVRERTTGWIANAYRALRIPKDHILLFDQGLAATSNPYGENPYHASTILNPVYVPQWKTMYGSPTAP